MAACQKCSSARVAYVSAKCSDLCFVSIGSHEHNGYVPDDMGVTDEHSYGDYVNIRLCLDCGHVQGKWPLPTSAIEKGEGTPV